MTLFLVVREAAAAEREMETEKGEGAADAREGGGTKREGLEFANQVHMGFNWAIILTEATFIRCVRL